MEENNKSRVIEGVGIVDSISDIRTSRNSNQYKIIEIRLKGFCWQNTTGLFEQIDKIKPGDQAVKATKRR